MDIDHQVPDYSKHQPGQEEGGGKAEEDDGPGQIDGGGEEVLEEAVVLLAVPRVGVDPPMLAHQPVPLRQVVHHTKHTGLLPEQTLPAGAFLCRGLKGGLVKIFKSVKTIQMVKKNKFFVLTFKRLVKLQNEVFSSLE